METSRIIRWPEVKRMAGLSRPTIWRMERAGKFPGRVELGGNSRGWLSSEVEAWITSRPRIGGKVEGAR